MDLLINRHFCLSPSSPCPVSGSKCWADPCNPNAFRKSVWDFCRIFLWRFKYRSVRHCNWHYWSMDSHHRNCIWVSWNFTARFFQKRSMSRKNVISFAIIGTLFYDAFTGLSIGPLFFHQSLIIAFVGQIPFTALHLAGNIMFSLLISPALYGFLMQHQRVKQGVSEVSLSPKPVTI